MQGLFLLYLMQQIRRCIIMGKNYFTDEQQEQLQCSPYIEKVSEKSITYTKKFKERFANEYTSGKIPSQILADMGIDAHVIGKRRQNSIVARIKKYELRPEGFESLQKGRPSTKELSDVERIHRLEQKVAYLSQENEFLKKNIQVDRQVNWEYKRNHASNTNLSKK